MCADQFLVTSVWCACRWSEACGSKGAARHGARLQWWSRSWPVAPIIRSTASPSQTTATSATDQFAEPYGRVDREEAGTRIGDAQGPASASLSKRCSQFSASCLSSSAAAYRAYLLLFFPPRDQVKGDNVSPLMAQISDNLKLKPPNSSSDLLQYT